MSKVFTTALYPIRMETPQIPPYPTYALVITMWGFSITLALSHCKGGSP